MKAQVFYWSVSHLAAATVFFAALADYLFYGADMGWTAGFYILCLCTVIIFHTRGNILNPFSPAHNAGLLMAGIVPALVFEPGAISITIGIVGLASFSIFCHRPMPVTFRRWRFCMRDFFFVEWLRIFFDTSLLRRRAQFLKVLTKKIKPLAAWLLPFFLSCLFLALFTEANPLIANIVDSTVQKITTAIDRFLLLLSLPRISFWIFSAIALWTLFRAKVWPHAPRGHAAATGCATILQRYREADFAKRCLLLFNLVFAVQTLLDMTYLWGGFALPEGMTHAEYAHRGAYPLLASALMAALFILVVFPPRGRAEQDSTARNLVYGYILQNIIVVASAFMRLALYVEAFNLTRWRVAAAIWIILVGAGFVTIFLRLYRSLDNGWLININAIVLLTVLYACAYSDIDGAIAQYNISKAKVSAYGVTVDIHYLKLLGYEAIPSLEWVAAQAPKTKQAKIAMEYALGLKQELLARVSDWRGWSVLANSYAGRSPNLTQGYHLTYAYAGAPG